MMYWDERGWYITEDELKDDYEQLKANNETEANTYEEYVINCTDKDGALERCEDMFCKNCIDAIKSRGERCWTTGSWTEGKCDWCEEEDVKVTWVKF